MKRNRPRRVGAAVTVILVFTAAGPLREAVGQSPGVVPIVFSATNQEVERTIRIVESGIEETSRAVGNLADRFADDQKALAKIVEQLKALQAVPRDAPPQPQATGVQSVKGRVPRTRPADKTESIVFVLENGRVTPVNLGAAMTSLAESVNSGRAALKGVHSSPVGHFDVKYEIGAGVLSLELVRKPGSEHYGEALAKFNSPGSESRRLIETTDSSTHFIQFGVYPDSFELFRHVRSFAVQHEFEMGFLPVAPGELISLGGGRGRVN